MLSSSLLQLSHKNGRVGRGWQVDFFNFILSFVGIYGAHDGESLGHQNMIGRVNRVVSAPVNDQQQVDCSQAASRSRDSFPCVSPIEVSCAIT
jgi:hypothetical protein